MRVAVLGRVALDRSTNGHGGALRVGLSVPRVSGWDRFVLSITRFDDCTVGQRMTIRAVGRERRGQGVGGVGGAGQAAGACVRACLCVYVGGRLGRQGEGASDEREVV